jgi:hypothetical protein
MKLPPFRIAILLPASFMANPLAAHLPETCKYVSFCSYNPSCCDYCKQSGRGGIDYRAEAADGRDAITARPGKGQDRSSFVRESWFKVTLHTSFSFMPHHPFLIVFS